MPPRMDRAATRSRDGRVPRGCMNQPRTRAGTRGSRSALRRAPDVARGALDLVPRAIRLDLAPLARQLRIELVVPRRVKVAVLLSRSRRIAIARLDVVPRTVERGRGLSVRGRNLFLPERLAHRIARALIEI